MAACGLKRCVLEHREGRVRQVDGFALAPRHLLADENGLVYALLREARIDSGTLQRGVDPGAAEPQNCEHYMVGTDVVPAGTQSLVTADFENLQKFFRKA